MEYLEANKDINATHVKNNSLARVDRSCCKRNYGISMFGENKH